MQMSKLTRSDRLRTFIRACSFRTACVEDPDPDRILEVMNLLIPDIAGRPDRVALKAAICTVAFFQQMRELLAGEVSLDFREEAILEAILKHLEEVS
jgi:hypothetical protein